jgi:hypothetical protein
VSDRAEADGIAIFGTPRRAISGDEKQAPIYGSHKLNSANEKTGT